MSKTLTKANIVERIHEQVKGLSKKEAVDIVETVFSTMKEVLEKGDQLKLSGFGNFTSRDKRPRVGRNPQSGGRLTISARRVLTFKPSHLLKGAINSSSKS